MELTLGFSPCPNDTFIFDALIHGKINTGGLKFKVFMADVEQLNLWAAERKLDISKLSYHAFAYVAGSYRLMHSGSALGRKNGPLFISKDSNLLIANANPVTAIPGKLTTANLLFSIFYPHITQKPEYLFSDIEKTILEGKTDAGVIIHESRFTFEQKGLKKITDLGEKWETETGFPIPLGGIAIHQRVQPEIQLQVESLIRKSVEFAFANPESGKAFIKKHSQELDDSIIRKHIDLYVNDYTLDLGKEGKDAVAGLFRFARRENLFSFDENSIFVG